MTLAGRHGGIMGRRITDRQRYAKIWVEGLRHDRTFKCEKNEGERGVDDRCDGGAEAAKSSPAREEIDIDIILGAVIGDGNTGEKDDDGGGDDAPDAFSNPQATAREPPIA